jgi:hypothetical protein
MGCIIFKLTFSITLNMFYKYIFNYYIFVNYLVFIELIIVAILPLV